MRYLSFSIALALLLVSAPYLAQSASSSASAWSIDGIFPPAGPTDGMTKVTIYSSYLQGRNYSSNRFPRCQFGTNGPIVDADWVHCHSLGDHYTKPTVKFANFMDAYDIFDNLDESIFLGRPFGNNTCLVCVSPAISTTGPLSLKVSVNGDFTDTQEAEFRYYVQPKVYYTVPFIGRQEGGTYVQVHGSGFQDFRDMLKCGFGTKHVEAKFVDDGLVVCIAPKSDVIDMPVPLTLTLNIQQATPTYSEYYYYAFPEITQLVPDRGPYTGGTRVNIYGKSMHPFKSTNLDVSNTSFVRFGTDYIMPLEIYNQTVAFVTTPAPYVEITLPVEITFNDQEWTSNGILFTFYAPPYVFQLIPNVGPIEGGTNCTVHGANFEDTGNITCDFGGHYSTGHYIDGNRIWCIAPRGDKAQYVDFKLSTEAGKWSGNNLKYLYYEQPFVSDVSPLCGPTTGYTQIAVTGKNFIYTGPHKVYCIFGDDIWMDATVINDRLLYCNSPRVLDKFGVNVNNTVSLPIRVTFNLVDMVATNRVFTYYTQPTEISVSPHFGPTDGGTQVTIIGKNITYYCNLTVRFATIEVSGTLVTVNNVTAISPAVRMPNDVEVDVSLNGQQYTRANPDLWITRFSYYKAPIIGTFQPDKVPNTGNTIITLSGEDFMHSRNDSTGVKGKEKIKYLCRFRDADGYVIGINNATYADDMTVKCLSPAVDQPLKGVKVDVSPNDGQNWHTAPGKSFDYYLSPVVTAILPQFGPLRQYNAYANVVGKNYLCPDSTCAKLACKWTLADGSIITDAKFINSTTVSCHIPGVSKPGQAVVSLTFDGDTFTTQTVQYTFFDAFILSIDPSLIPVRGNPNVIINGYGFADTGKLNVRLGPELPVPLSCYGKTPCIVSATFIDANRIKVAIPPQSDIKWKNGSSIGYEPFPVEVNVYSNQFTDNNVTVQYYQEPTLTGLKDLVPPAFHMNSPYTVKIPIDLKIPAHVNPQDYLQKINTTCRFVVKGQAYYIPGPIILYPYPKGDDAPKNYSVACPAPVMNEPGTGSISVSINGGDYLGNISLRVEDELKIINTGPRCGPANGSYPVLIDTLGFDETDYNSLYFLWDTTCTSPITKSQLNGNTTTQFKVAAPSSPNFTSTLGGYAYVLFAKRIQYKGPDGTVVDTTKNYLDSRGEFFYYKEPSVLRVEPHSGWYTGGTVVEIEGSDFFSNPDFLCVPRCRFGTKEGKAEYVSSVKIRCTTPLYDLPNAVANLEISMNGIDWRSTGTNFTFISPPKITGVSPSSGTSAGGTILTIVGTGFMDLTGHPGEFVCIFESSKLGRRLRTPITFKNSSTVVCTTPGGWGSGTLASVGISYNGIDTVDTGVKFKFYQIDRVYPISGPATGGGYITIQGSGFSKVDGMGCQIDGVTSPAESANWTHIQCPLPRSKQGANFTGTVTFLYTLNGVDFLQVFGGFSYYKQPSVVSVSPKLLPKSGANAKVQFTELYGDILNLNATCKVGDTIVLGSMARGSNTIYCHFNDMNVDPSTTSQSIQISLNGYHFTDINANSSISVYSINQLTPRSGTFKGDTSITVDGYGFMFNNTVRCRFGTPEQSLVTFGTTVDAKTIVCKSPAFTVPSNAQLPYTVPFAISYASEDGDDSYSSTEHTFTFFKAPKITKIEPAQVPIDQTAKVIVTSDKTNSFAAAIAGSAGILDKTAIKQLTITCKFGNLGETKADIIANDKITCSTPPLSENPATVSVKQVGVTVAINGQDYSDTSASFEFKGALAPESNKIIWIILIIIVVIVLVGLVFFIYTYVSRRNRQRGLAFPSEDPSYVQ
eukprot:CAMPEP_0176452896 /NCGR_PEP_ID=MMETSP0127-20121128/28863_1 /TAXON_ID=938130 /ORGANISM="Platyophrya macrostoma, Strain WH" /LENGTH=1801 /DNA_ID=CAMNT_0017841547 /DNA_START=33 /DNA_END=5438 /DNA_ORIENTATION=+